MGLIKKTLRIFWRLLDMVTACALAFMIAVVFINVVLRYGFESGLHGSFELSRLLFVWVVMLGAVACLRCFDHLALEGFVESFFPKAKIFLRPFINLVIFGCSLMLFFGSAEQVGANWSNVLPISGIPTGLFYLAGAVGGFLMAALALLRIFMPSAAAPDTHAQSGDGNKELPL